MRPLTLTDAAGGGADRRQHLEQGGFARAVVADDADHLALFDGEADIIQRLEQRAFFNFFASQACGRVEQGLLEAMQGAQAVFLGEVVDFDDRHGGSVCSQGG